jgi:hypothetical protein
MYRIHHQGANKATRQHRVTAQETTIISLVFKQKSNQVLAPKLSVLPLSRCTGFVK